MTKIKVTCSIGFPSCDYEEIVDVTDMNEAEIQQMVHEMAMEHASSWEGDERLGEWDEDSIEHFSENAYGTWEYTEEDE